MKFFTLSIAVCFCFCFILSGVVGYPALLKSVKDVTDGISVISSDDTHVREYTALWWPLFHPRAIQLKGAEITKTGDHSVALDAVEFDLSTYNETALYFGYFHASADAPNGINITNVAESAFAFIMRAYVVFEYVEFNGVPGFQNGTADNITGYYDLSSLELTWKDMQINETKVTDENGQQFSVFIVTVETTDEVFLMRFIVAGTPISVSGVDLTPSSMKIDFAIRWFTDLHVAAPWTSGPSDNPNAQVGLAILMVAEAVSVSENATGSNPNPSSNNSVEFNAGGAVAFFNWETQADTIVQGYQAAAAVSADITESASGESVDFKAGWLARLIWFSFDGIRPSEVVWDPELGSRIDYSDQNASSSNVILPCIALVFFALLSFF